MTKEYTINNPVLAILADLAQEQANLMGFACYIWNIEQTLLLVRQLKKVSPQTLIVLGGPEATYRAEDLLERFPAVDGVIQGEGEKVWQTLLSRLAADGWSSCYKIPGLAVRTEQGYLLNGGPQYMASLDDIPFPYAEEEMEGLSDRILYYESSRGCPFSCGYCLSGAEGGGVRFLSLKRVLDDLTFFIRHKVRQVKFVDRTFNCRKEHYLPIWEFLAHQHTASPCSPILRKARNR